MYACPPTDDCLPHTSWLVVTDGRTPTQVSFGPSPGRFDVWVGLDPADPTGNTLLLRSVGTDARGSRRLLEVAVAAGSGQTL